MHPCYPSRKILEAFRFIAVGFIDETSQMLDCGGIESKNEMFMVVIIVHHKCGKKVV